MPDDNEDPARSVRRSFRLRQRFWPILASLPVALVAVVFVWLLALLVGFSIEGIIERSPGSGLLAVLDAVLPLALAGLLAFLIAALLIAALRRAIKRR